MYDAGQEQSETMRYTCSILDTFEPQQLFKFRTKKIVVALLRAESFKVKCFLIC